MSISELSTASEAEIIAEATARGYEVRQAPGHYSKPGWRIGGTTAPGRDDWMNAANNRLYQIQTREGE